MKKLFHLGIIALFAFTVSSCSKSATNLAPNEQQVPVNSSKAKAGSSQKVAHHTSPFFQLEDSKFYPFINEPYDMPLGDAGSVMGTGEYTFFYVLISPDISILTPDVATLTTTDVATGGPIQTYNLISYKDAGSVDAKIPEELIGTTFMFAYVLMDDRYTDIMISLSSYIEINGAFTIAQLPRAFSVVQN